MNFLSRRIPTLLGLAVLTLGLTSAVFLVSNTQIIKTRASPILTPQNLMIASISPSSVTIFFQTTTPTIATVEVGPLFNGAKIYKDDRDTAKLQERTLHIFTLNKLQAETTYHFKISIGGKKVSTPGEFKTTSIYPPQTIPPLIGQIVDSSGLFIKEALIELKIPGAQSLVTVSKLSGSFILPLSSLLLSDLTAPYQFPESGISATLNITDGSKNSQVKLKLPREDRLPQITLGQDLDLLTITESTESAKIEGDLNADGFLNAYERALLESNLKLQTVAPTSKAR